jgi:hypothetical protein
MNALTIPLMAFLALMTLKAKAQTFDVVGGSANGSAFKLTGQIVIGDSLATFKFSGKEATKKIVNKTDGTVIYITDGTATDRYTITNFSGKVRGAAYNSIIYVTPDQRFNKPGDYIYYVRKN